MESSFRTTSRLSLTRRWGRCCSLSARTRRCWWENSARSGPAWGCRIRQPGAFIQTDLTRLHGNAIRPACPYEHPAEDVPADGPPGQGERQLGGGAEGLAAKRAKAVGAVSQATEQLDGALQGVDAVEAMVADGQGGAAVLAEVGLDIEHQAAENRILGPGETQGNLSLLGHTLPLVLPGQPLLLAFFRPVVCKPVMLSSALRRMASERAWSVTTRETVSAPIRVKA